MKTGQRRRGFTLLELLAVMSIVALLSTLAVMSYFNAIRGMGHRSMIKNVSNALATARQRANVDGRRVSLIAYNEVGKLNKDGATIEDRVAVYVICRELGRLSFVSGNNLFDEFSDLDKLFQVGAASSSDPSGAVKLYNLTRGGWSYVDRKVKKDTVGGTALLHYEDQSRQFRAYAFQRLGEGRDVNSENMTGAVGGQNSPWSVGDSYGIEVSPAQALPKRYAFTGLESDTIGGGALSKVVAITFEPDGSVKSSAYNQKMSLIVTTPGKNDVTFTVNNKGKITISGD